MERNSDPDLESQGAEDDPERPKRPCSAYNMIVCDLLGRPPVAGACPALPAIHLRLKPRADRRGLLQLEASPAELHDRVVALDQGLDISFSCSAWADAPK